MTRFGIAVSSENSLSLAYLPASSVGLRAFSVIAVPRFPGTLLLADLSGCGTGFPKARFSDLFFSYFSSMIFLLSSLHLSPSPSMRTILRSGLPLLILVLLPLPSKLPYLHLHLGPVTGLCQSMSRNASALYSLLTRSRPILVCLSL